MHFIFNEKVKNKEIRHPKEGRTTLITPTPTSMPTYPKVAHLALTRLGSVQCKRKNGHVVWGSAPTEGVREETANLRYFFIKERHKQGRR